MSDPFLYTAGMNDQQRLLFMSELNQRRKNPTTGVLLALFLGGVGAHRFYMGQAFWGVIYLLMFWTLIPLIASVIELFLMSGRVERHNDAAAVEVVMRVKALASAST